MVPLARTAAALLRPRLRGLGAAAGLGMEAQSLFLIFNEEPMNGERQPTVLALVENMVKKNRNRFPFSCCGAFDHPHL